MDNIRLLLLLNPQTNAFSVSNTEPEGQSLLSKGRFFFNFYLALSYIMIYIYIYHDICCPCEEKDDELHITS